MRKMAINVIMFFVIATIVAGVGQNIFGGKEPYKSPQEREIERLHKELEINEGHLLHLENNNKKLVEQANELRGELMKDTNKTNMIIQTINENVKGKLAGKGEIFHIASQFYNVNPLLMVAISMHETANGTSQMINQKNNIGGFYYKGFLNFKTIDESIFYMARLLKSEYIDKGLTNIELIGSKYCPIGAGNDPTGLNVNWVPRVTEIYLDLYNQTGGAL